MNARQKVRRRYPLDLKEMRKMYANKGYGITALDKEMSHDNVVRLVKKD